ncbi:MAG: hypothetical protein GKS06_11070 [Acidobacteria bacterium]|nr:hypothetical protein [Acidobacteriota bacterium]
MALAKKGSRRIAVGGDSYRWVVSPDDGYMVIVVEGEAQPAQRLQAYVSYGIDPDAPRRITPAVVRRAIELGLAEGWLPDHRGLAPFKLDNADARVWPDDNGEHTRLERTTRGGEPWRGSPE